ncbi:hypothetical protein Syun_018643 [Stephania yunnanensis]|uniref:Ankyrin repeat-containing protein BDA1-like n=1 Tax=Stephania yunnanensis TaxID=152371 RepID=A0AAP0ISN9_9MAGN
MDGRLFVAARNKNVGDLHQLLEEDPLQFHVVALVSGDTPLHIASMTGHLEFVKEMTRLMPGFACELNQDGFSPMHLAAANGYLENVRELLKIDCNLYRLKEFIEDVAIGEEIVIHLAIMNYQFEAFGIIFEKLKQLNRDTVLNSKDEQGDMVLHINDIAFNCCNVIELLLCNDFLSRAVEVNAINSSNLTSLNFLQGLPREISSGQIETMLLRAGAIHSEAISNEHGNVASLIRSFQPLG